jgi:hypothetical protein
MKWVSQADGDRFRAESLTGTFTFFVRRVEWAGRGRTETHFVLHCRLQQQTLN